MNPCGLELQEHKQAGNQIRQTLFGLSSVSLKGPPPLPPPPPASAAVAAAAAAALPAAALSAA